MRRNPLLLLIHEPSALCLRIQEDEDIIMGDSWKLLRGWMITTTTTTLLLIGLSIWMVKHIQHTKIRYLDIYLDWYV